MNLPSSPPVEHKQRGSFPWRVLGTIFSLALLVYLIWVQGWDEFASALQQLSVWHILAGIVLIFLSRMMVTLRWYILLRSANMKIGFFHTLRLTFMGLFASNFLPSTVGGDLVRMAGLVHLRLDAGVSAASLVADRLIGMAGMALLLPVGLAAVLRSEAVVVSAFPGASWLLERGRRFIKSLGESLVLWLRNPVSLILAFLFTLAHMLFTFLTILILLEGMGQSLSLIRIGGLWSLSYFVSLLPVSINGLGLQEVSITYLYSHLGGITMQAGLALAVLLRMLFMVVSLPGVFFLPDILRPMAGVAADKKIDTV